MPMSEPKDTAQADETPENSREPQPCMPCHGTGRVISNLGDTQRKVACPWCRGGGVRIPGADAQEYQREQSQQHVR